MSSLFRVLLLWLFVNVMPLHARVYLVSVGIANYPGTKSDLRISDNDAKSIAKVFLATKDASANVLINENATMSALLNTIQTTFKEAKSDDAVIL